MANPNISATLSSGDITTIQTNTAATLAVLTFLVNLTPTERKKLRKMATKREGYVSTVHTAAVNNPTAIPASFDMTEYTKDVDLIAAMKTVRDSMLPLIEGIDDTILSLSHELMEQSDSCYGFLQTAAKGDPALTTIVKGIATAFAGQGKKKNFTLVSIPAGGSITQGNLKKGHAVISKGSTVLSINTPNGKKADAIIINPNSSTKLLATWTEVVITNLSLTDEGQAAIYLKS